MMHGAPEGFTRILREEACSLGMELTDQAVWLAQKHAALLFQWRTRMNLLSFQDLRELVRRHFLESFVAAQLLPPSGLAPTRLLDIGGGAGFPGLAMRAVRPDVELTVLEPRARRAQFLAAVAATQPRPVPRILACNLSSVASERGWDSACFRAVVVRASELLPRLAPHAVVLTFPGRNASTDATSRMLASARMTRGECRELPDRGRLVVAWHRPG